MVWFGVTRCMWLSLRVSLGWNCKGFAVLIILMRRRHVMGIFECEAWKVATSKSIKVFVNS